MKDYQRNNALLFLQNLTDQPLCYGIKSPDTELYDIGFGRIERTRNSKGEEKEVSRLTLHILCRFKVIWRNEKHRIDRYYEDTSAEKFSSDISKLEGMKVVRVALSEKMICG